MLVKEIPVETSQGEQLIDITGRVNRMLEQEGIDSGTVQLFVPHTTAGLVVNENADPDVGKDILNYLRKMVPPEGDYSHGEGNSDAHIKSTLVGHTCSFLVNRGRLLLGRWQSVFFAEFDGPRHRKVYLGTGKGHGFI